MKTIPKAPLEHSPKCINYYITFFRLIQVKISPKPRISLYQFLNWSFKALTDFIKGHSKSVKSKQRKMFLMLSGHTDHIQDEPRTYQTWHEYHRKPENLNIE